MSLHSDKVILMILDGWGIGKKDKADAIFQGITPNIDRLFKEYPNTHLLTDGENVGLPEGQMGNSEVGHLNIGAGRVIYQDLVKINKEIREGKIDQHPVLQEAFRYAKENDKAVHFIGLVSDGGVHSMDTHLHKLCDITDQAGLEKVYIHALTDGRDTDPRSGYGFIKDLLQHLETSKVKVASLIGRYYTMDRDKRWERVKEGYDLMVNAKGTPSRDLLKSMEDSYSAGITDEFIRPVLMVDEANQPIGQIKADDVVICFNFRTDRLREITTVLSQKDLPEFGMQKLPLYYLTMTRYDDTYQGIRVIYDKDNVSNTLGEVLASHGKKQIRIAETEKYAHVTFFFSGGREQEFPGEKRILIPSPKVATYDLQPEMSAFLVKDAIVSELNKAETDFVCLNFANGDMVGHTGVMEAILKAVNAVDTCVGEVVEAALNNGYLPLILADHGNADNALNEDGSPNTAHSLNPVPFLVCTRESVQLRPGVLADVAPSILKIMGIDPPKEMDGNILIY